MFRHGAGGRENRLSPPLMEKPTLPPDVRLGTVHLRVGDLDRMVRFYLDVLGMTLLAEDGAVAALGTLDARPLLILHEAPGGVLPPRGSPGLFHVAFRVPSRADLGAMVRRVQGAGVSFDGFGDHNVSEAAYLRDPEGNGLELYADRSRDVWHSVDGSVFMTTEPLDLPGLLIAAREAAPNLPRGTVVGHVHLRVSSLADAEMFYADHLGFDVVTRSYPGALFLSAGGYHHHIGANTWDSAGGDRVPHGSLGLASFELIVPSEEVRRKLLGGHDEGLLFDPNEIAVRITAG